jgi:sarcosine oxidase subunit beta
MQRADVAIVGGGVIGCAIAFELTRHGVADVALFERGSLAGGATGVCPGGIRQQFTTETDCRLARRSVGFFEQINEILQPDMPFTFERSGYLFLADTEAVLEQYRQNVAVQNRAGVPSRIVPVSEIADRYPALVLDGVIGGAFCAEDGFLEDCHGVTHLLAQRARERGARVLHEEVLAVTPADGAWSLRTRTGSFSAARVVLAAGVNSVPLAESAGVRLPIVTERRRLAFTAPYEPKDVMPPLVIALERGFAGKQLHYGVFYFGWLAETEDADDLTFMERGLEAGATLCPPLADLPVRRVISGLYDTTPDHRPILGPSGIDGLFLAVGFSGHGYMIAPAVAEGVVAAMLGRPVELPLSAFSLARFAGQATAEGLVI